MVERLVRYCIVSNKTALVVSVRTPIPQSLRCGRLERRISGSPIATVYREPGSSTRLILSPVDADGIFVRKLRNRLPQASVSAEFEKASGGKREVKDEGVCRRKRTQNGDLL